MVKTSGYWLPEYQSPWESYTSKNCMIAPVEQKLCGFLPASTNLWSISHSGLNGLGFSGVPEVNLAHEADGLIGKSIPHFQIPPPTPNEYIEEQTSLFPAMVDVLTSTYQTPSCQQKKFLIFDQSGNDTRLLYNSFHSHWSQLVEDQPNEKKLVCTEKPVLQEESGENVTVDEGSELREDTEEINALLYSDDDDLDGDCDGEGEEDDEASTGHSPLVNHEEDDCDEAASFDRSSKRQKAFDGGHYKLPLKRSSSFENMHGGDLLYVSNEEVDPTIGNKRMRKGKILGTLRALESIIPGLKSKDPVVILEEAICYLKKLRSNAETMSMENPDGSTCYGPSN